MNKMKYFFVVAVLCNLVFSAHARKEEVTLVMVPREELTVRLGIDLANRYPTLLVSYRVLANGSVSLHGWTGTQWVNIKTEDYEAGSFFKNGPNSALIIEEENTPVPESMIPSEDWCQDVSKVTTTKTRPLIHLVGQYYNFDFKDWQWFSRRYNQPIDAINPENLNMSWYHKRLNDHLGGSDQQGISDLQYWESVRQSMTVPDSDLEEVDVESTVADDADDTENPFTNSVPSAVILGAGDVPEEHSPDSTNSVSEVMDEME